MLRLIITESDYIYSEAVNAFVLPDREIGPGNPALTPTEGAILYNNWIGEGCPGSDALSDFETMVNHALSNEPGSSDVAQYLLYAMGNDGILLKPLPESCSWAMQLLFSRNTMNSMERASFLQLRNALMRKVGNDNE